ncbi:RNA exonuclease 1 homolog [Xyrichtys novacula]|uniref:RNA exonuclease 1 homolog n=1 Tax=Xyrichtys novacula TaxID=13765 RepID=A0AAV1FKE3_XYRNO|nr:RNA exonuclease 1 homolog [Xyrichtys novacula]
MLRSTGFFRGIDCPFYAEYTDGKGSKNGCNRPYCHFRHSRQRVSSSGAPADVRKHRDLHSAQKDQGYDPFNPEVVKPQDQQNGKPAPSGDLSGALEMVNKAIEEVRSEVEREKRKLSRIGDEPYDPSESSTVSTSTPVKSKAQASHMAYDPGSYQMTSGDYNPTPSCSKYTLDSDKQGNLGNSMEYVPTSVKKASSRIHVHQPSSSPPPSQKYSSCTSSSKCKYTVDNSKPSTDMEYDPLSNYAAGIAVKNKREGGVKAVKTHSLQGSSSVDEEYVVAVKKPRQDGINSKKYTCSESDEESSGTEYRPTSLSNIQQRKGNSGSLRDAAGKERKEISERIQNQLTQKNKEDSAGDSDVQEHVKRKESTEKKKEASQTSHEKSCKSDRVHKATKEGSKTGGSKSGSSSSSKDKVSIKKSDQDSAKKENQSHGKRDDRKNTVKVKTSDKVLREGREEKKSGDKIKAVEKVRTDSSKRDRDAENGARESKKPKLSEKEKDHKKYKDHLHKNGKLDSSRREKDGKKISKSSSGSSSHSKGGSANSRDKLKQNQSSANGKSKEAKHRNRSFSHVDLFGDESPDEAEPIMIDDSDDDDEEEEVLVRKSADALKRSHLNKRKASELTPSSSDEEDNGGVEDSRTGKDELDNVGIDFSSFHDDLDFDSDPMEECLRIFNESKDVKREDKGRQAKQPSRDVEEEKNTESTLTTLFPGQKKRVSHFVAKGNTDAPSKTVVQPYRRLTAQEVCYRRMQLAQQQASQLSASVKTSPQSSSSSFSGEKKRIAHRPNPQTTSSKTNVKPAASRALSPSHSHQTIKTQTTAGILPKTMSTATQKRVAHTPTMKSSSMRRPVIPTEFGAKVPTNIRQRYLNTFIDECVKFCSSEEVAFQMALDEENLVYDRSSSKNIYLNVAVNTLKKLRNKSSSNPPPITKDSGSASNRKAQSHEEVLGGRLAATTSFTVNRTGKQQEEKLVGATLFRKLKAYLMTEEQLQEHNYPRANPEAAGRAVIYNLPEKKATTDPFSKICCRCGAEYKVNVNGSCVRKEECSFHWGRLRRQKVAGAWETNYNCCAAAVGTPGCQVGKQHVQDGRKESFDGYVTTFSKSLPLDGNAGVFALDCEMCYTKQGLELTRVTVINSELNVIYDTFVKPDSKVVDYNTRFSGVTEEDLENTTTSLRDVQAVLLSMFSAESILIGHSLESDLLALKLIHSSVVDTAIVFPHRLGLPYKRALRNLMADHLKRIIQDNVEGHDSSEDASACMELMMWKIKEDAKVKR